MAGPKTRKKLKKKPVKKITNPVREANISRRNKKKTWIYKRCTWNRALC